MDIEIGANVRIISKCGEYSRKGYIAYANEDGTCDVIYQKSGGGDEESSVAVNRITPLLSFENETFKGSPLEAKEYGNKLFELRDFEAAYEFYITSHNMMQSTPLSVGKHVIVRIDTTSQSSTDGDKISSCNFEGAIVSDIRANGCIDVIYDVCVLSTGSDEEEEVTRDRVYIIFKGNKSPLIHDIHILCVHSLRFYHPLPSSPVSHMLSYHRILSVHSETGPQCDALQSEISNLNLQRAVLLNLSKCALKRGLKGWAVRWALVATALIKCKWQ